VSFFAAVCASPPEPPFDGEEAIEEGGRWEGGVPCHDHVQERR